MSRSRKLNVLLVVGGDSSEKDVSLDSGRSIFPALRSAGHRVWIADPARPDVPLGEDPERFFGGAKIGSEPPRPSRDPYAARRRFFRLLEEFERLRCDVLFNALHGGVGEDGTFQAVLDYLGVPYTGSGACACALAMDKALSKRLAIGAAVAVAEGLVFDGSDSGDDVEERVLETLSLPVVVKPNREGSSVGVTIVTSKNELATAVEKARSFGGALVVERYIEGSEITAPILEGAELPLLEIRPKKGFFDYENKYAKGACDYLVPAPLDEAISRAISADAAAAYGVMGCRGYARVDFRLGVDGRHYFLEVNTLPGLTSTSLVPKAAKAAGIEFPELIDRILRLSMSSRCL